MRVFLTGATGFIGFPLVKELIAAGHQVTGLARSEASGKKLIDAGAQVQVGTVDDLDGLRRGARPRMVRSIRPSITSYRMSPGVRG